MDLRLTDDEIDALLKEAKPRAGTKTGMRFQRTNTRITMER